MKKLPDGCCYPDCFSCPLADCVLPDNVLHDSENMIEVEQLIEERKQLVEELHKKGQQTRQSKRYYELSSRISYLQHIDMRKLKKKKWYEKHKHSARNVNNTEIRKDSS